jgi:hypothetical protein
MTTGRKYIFNIIYFNLFQVNMLFYILSVVTSVTNKNKSQSYFHITNKLMKMKYIKKSKGQIKSPNFQVTKSSKFCI